MRMLEHMTGNCLKTCWRTWREDFGRVNWKSHISCQALLSQTLGSTVRCLEEQVPTAPAPTLPTGTECSLPPPSFEGSAPPTSKRRTEKLFRRDSLEICILLSGEKVHFESGTKAGSKIYLFMPKILERTPGKLRKRWFSLPCFNSQHRISLSISCLENGNWENGKWFHTWECFNTECFQSFQKFLTPQSWDVTSGEFSFFF